jgi:hypothetical protein
MVVMALSATNPILQKPSLPFMGMKDSFNCVRLIDYSWTSVLGLDYVKSYTLLDEERLCRCIDGRLTRSSSREVLGETGSV